MRVLSGIKPSGRLHIGNYFGSVRPNIAWMEKADQNIFFIADLHALTTVHDAEALRGMRQDIFLDYLACGFDPEAVVMFYQSDVPQHVELSWILGCLASMGLLERAHAYKDALQKGLSASVGLFTYPVLMAADILLYDADIVPVGKDQKQHVEIARDLAGKFNATFGETLKLPEPEIQEDVAVVTGTDGQKMSKSYGNTIPLFGSEKEVKKAIMGIVTDSRGATDPKDPDASPIFQIHRLFLSQSERAALADEYRNGLPYGDAKKRLLGAYMDYFAPMRARREELLSRPDELSLIMQTGAEHARAIAGRTMERVRTAVGL